MDIADIVDRKKRQLGFVFGLLGLGNSIYNSFQINNIQAAVDDISERQDLMVKTMELHRRAIIDMERSIAHIYQTTETLIKSIKQERVDQVIQDSVQNMQFATTVMVQHVDETIEALTQLINHKLHPNFVDLDVVKMEFAKINKRLGQDNMRLFNSHAAAIFHFPLSIFRKGDELRYMVYVPISTHLEQLQVLEFIPTPFHLGNFTATVATNNPLLIIDDHATFYTEQPLEFLDRCMKSGNSFHCSGTSLFSKDTKRSCLTRLHTHDLDKIEEFWDIRVTEKTEVIQQLTSRKFRILSDKPTQVGIACKGGVTDAPTKLMVKGNQTIELNSTCEVTTKHYVFTTSMDMFDHQALVNLSIDFTSMILKSHSNDLEMD